MGLIARDAGGQYELAPEGAHTAICVQVIDLGMQAGFYGVKPKVLIGWELTQEHDSKDEPFLVWKRYTLSTNAKATLRGDLEAWRGRKFTADEIKAFDLKNILGKPCQVQIVHNDEGEQTYANVVSIMSWPKGMPTPEPKHSLVSYDIDQHYDPKMQDIFKSFRPKLQETILKAHELSGRASPAEVNAAFDDGPPPPSDADVPF